MSSYIYMAVPKINDFGLPLTFQHAGLLERTDLSNAKYYLMYIADSQIVEPTSHLFLSLISDNFFIWLLQGSGIICNIQSFITLKVISRTKGLVSRQCTILSRAGWWVCEMLADSLSSPQSPCLHFIIFTCTELPPEFLGTSGFTKTLCLIKEYQVETWKFQGFSPKISGKNSRIRTFIQTAEVFGILPHTNTSFSHF